MKDTKLKVSCDVCSCVYNRNGCNCSRDNIEITKSSEDEKTHYCSSYEFNCGFRPDNK